MPAQHCELRPVGSKVVLGLYGQWIIAPPLARSPVGGVEFGGIERRKEIIQHGHPPGISIRNTVFAEISPNVVSFQPIDEGCNASCTAGRQVGIESQFLIVSPRVSAAIVAIKILVGLVS